MPSADILQPLPSEKWPFLADNLKKNWPSNVHYYYVIQIAMKWKSKVPNLPFTIYSLGGDHNSGIFIAVSSYTYNFAITFAHEGFEDCLYEVVTKTKVINWDEGIILPAVASRLIPTVHSIVEFLRLKKGKTLEWSVPGNCFFKSKEECANVEIELPDDCYLKKLDETHVPLIHSVWPHRSEKHPEVTTKQVLAMVQLNGGLGLFSKHSNELLSWAVQSELGAISLVQTIERCRRKGYAKLVTNAFSKELATKGIESFVFIVKGNRPSESMFQSLDYKHNFGTDWLQVNEFIPKKES